MKKLRYYARYIVVCLLLNKMDLVKVLVKVRRKCLHSTAWCDVEPNCYYDNPLHLSPIAFIQRFSIQWILKALYNMA